MRAYADAVEQPRQQANAADVQGVRPVAATFHNILGVVFLIFVFAVVQMFTLWRVCKAGMATAASLEHQGLPTLNELASLQEHLAIYRLDSYECLFAREDEKVAKEKAVEAMTAQTQADFETIKKLFPGAGMGIVRSASGRETPFAAAHVVLTGALRHFEDLREGMAVGFDVGWTSKGLRVTVLHTGEQ